MGITYDEAPDSLRTHIQEIQRGDEEVLLADSVVDKGIVTQYWLVLTSERLITVSLGLIDTTSQSIDLENIEHATVNESGYRPKLTVQKPNETSKFELTGRTKEFAEKITLLYNEVKDQSERASEGGSNDNRGNASRQELVTTLQTAEEMFQTAIDAHLQEKRTVPRQRYQQAAQVFEEAQGIIKTSDAGLFQRPVRVNVGAPTLTPSRSIARLPLLPDRVTKKMEEQGIKTLGDVSSTDEDLVAFVSSQGTEARTKVRLHGAWTESGTVVFETRDMVVNRSKLINRASQLV